jgi:hypothetical protein
MVQRLGWDAVNMAVLPLLLLLLGLAVLHHRALVRKVSA